ncbi:uncharacterized protein DUF2691 [Paenibacillus cellulosilyticus]|uniref:Uncharacterized protein DUF2691 n=1 Tax=Paenibacillus cellulosilyticus TaxID=375489 RepID=A0A2V2YRM5_9BACL|nr:uncharacterized protein DUF2691 [Paenibacillus cellulosilyticus]QKS45552.1 DUF2691 family protein [Paenibacillus cellulosilyticus]
MIFQGMKAFPFNSTVVAISTYDEYINSDCQFILLVIDPSYVAMYCKDSNKLMDLHNNAINQGYEKVR